MTALLLRQGSRLVRARAVAGLVGEVGAIVLPDLRVVVLELGQELDLGVLRSTAFGDFDLSGAVPAAVIPRDLGAGEALQVVV